MIKDKAGFHFVSMRNRQRAETWAKALISILFVFITLIPFYISFIYSIKNKNEITINHLSWPKTII